MEVVLCNRIFALDFLFWIWDAAGALTQTILS
jgi:hypothetical protein